MQLGLNLAWEGINSLQTKPDWVTAHPRDVEDVLNDVEDARGSVLTWAPVASVFKAGVAAASLMTSAISLVNLARAGPAVLGRLIGWMRGLQIETAMLEVSGVGGVASIRVVASAETLVLTDTEVIALAQAGQLSPAALSLYMMAKGMPPKRPNEKAFTKWVGSLPTKLKPSSTPANLYEIKHTGPRNFLAEGGGKKIWADGVRPADSHLIEVKHVGSPDSSPFVDGTRCPPDLRAIIRGEVIGEIERYAAIIRDPKIPAVALEIITNDSRAVPFFESLLRRFSVPGQVVVLP